MYDKKKIFFAVLSLLGLLVLVVVAVSIFLFPWAYNSPSKIAVLIAAAVSSVLDTVKGFTSALDFGKIIFLPKTQTEKASQALLINNVPRQNNFLGREEELNTITQHLRDKNVKAIAITGIGGIGKSTLAQEAVHQSIRYFSGGAGWLSIRDFPAFSLERAIKELGRIFNLVPNDDDHQHQYLIRYLKTNPAVIILDNLEDLSHEELKQVRAFIDEVSTGWGSKFVLTLRPPLPFFDEKSDERHLHIKNGLDVKNASDYLLSLLPQNLSTNSDYVKDITWVVSRVQGHPKMLEVIAGATRRRGWERTRPLIHSLTGELQDKMDELYTGSVGLLNTSGQTLLTYLPLFPVPRFSHDDVAIACGDFDKIWVPDALDQICDSGLVSYNPQTQHCTVHQTVVDYIRSKFPIERSERVSACFRLTQYFGNKGHLGFAALMWREATETYEVSPQDVVRYWSSTVLAWLKAANATKSKEL